jgi:hypothetical protein
MQIYPQTSSGSVCQFPFTKTLQYRTIVNAAEDGSRVLLDDPNAAGVRWTLSYAGLTDSDLAVYQNFFATMSGRLQSFTFLDPAGNLFTWSEDFTQTAWQKSTLLHLQSGAGDSLGTHRGTTIANQGSGDLALAQSVSIPSSYLCCFSLFLSSPVQTNIALTRGSVSESFSISPVWRRVYLSTTTADGSDTSVFGITIPAGGQVTVFGALLEPQVRPSTYVPSLDRSGIYPATRFDSDTFSFRSEAPNSNSCEVKLYSRLAL